MYGCISAHLRASHLYVRVAKRVECWFITLHWYAKHLMYSVRYLTEGAESKPEEIFVSITGVLHHCKLNFTISHNVS